MTKILVVAAFTASIAVSSFAFAQSTGGGAAGAGRAGTAGTAGMSDQTTGRDMTDPSTSSTRNQHRVQRKEVAREHRAAGPLEPEWPQATERLVARAAETSRSGNRKPGNCRASDCLRARAKGIHHVGH
jgi:hypothetical protein